MVNTGKYVGRIAFTTGQVSKILDCAQQTAIRWFDDRILVGHRVGQHRRISRESLIKYMRENHIADRFNLFGDGNWVQGQSEDRPIFGQAELSGTGKKRVLIVEDDRAIVDMLEEALIGDGRFDFQSTGSGFEAGLIAATFHPHVVLLDYMLPDLRGDRVCRILREHPATRRAKIIFVSGAVHPDEVEGLKKAGADAFVAKPFSIESLLDLVAKLVGQVDAA